MTVVNPKSISGINSITTGSGSDNLLTIHTSDASSTERVRINSSGDVIVGSGITVSPDGDIFATGVTTATTFSGSGASLTNLNASAIASGTVPTARLGSGTASSSTFLRGDSTFATVTSVGGATGVDFNDNVKARFGTGNDLEIYHNASHSIIHDNGTGDLKIIGDDVIIQADNDDTMAKFIEDGAVELYHNNSKVFETTSVGVNITGQSTFVRHSADANLIVGSTGASGAYLVLDGDSNGDAAGGDYAYLLHNSSGDLVIDTRNPGGNSKMQFNVNGSERLRIHSGGDVEVKTGSLIIGTAGEGIDFSATGGPTNGTSSSERLEDYETGTFTPAYAMSGSASNMTYHDQQGQYVKVGNLVQISMILRINTVNANGSGNAFISGLPFTPAANSGQGPGYGSMATGYCNGLGGSPSFVHGYVEQGATQIYLYHSLSSGTSQNMTVASHLYNASQIRMSATYQVA